MHAIRRNFKTGGFDVTDEAGELVLNVADSYIARGLVAELEGVVALTAWAAADELDAETAERIERENLADDLAEVMDPSDIEAMSLSELRELASRLN